MMLHGSTAVKSSATRVNKHSEAWACPYGDASCHDIRGALGTTFFILAPTSMSSKRS